MANKKREDRRIRRTRQRLQSALIQLLKEKPLAKIQIKEIINLADVSRPTFYQHFGTKENLLLSHIDDLFDRIFEDVFSGVEEENPIDMLRLITASFEQWQRHRQELQWVLQVENKDLLMTSLQAHLAALKKEFDQHVTPPKQAQVYEKYLIGFITGGMYMVLKTWLDHDTPESPETMAHLTFLLLFNGFFPIQPADADQQALVGQALKKLGLPSL